MRLSLRQLGYFVAIAEQGSLSHAAQTLNVAQSALSHHVAQMEASLGVSLLERRPRGVALTPAGQRLFQHAHSILGQVRAAEDDIQTFSEAAVGRVSVGLAHTVLGFVALPLMHAARQHCPGVSLSISEGLSSTHVKRLLDGEIDVALIYNPPEDARLLVTTLLKEEMCLIGRPDLMGENGRPIAFADLPETTIVSQYSGGALKAIVGSHMLRSKLRLNRMLEIDSLTALKLALEDGLGCSILSRASVIAQVTLGTLSARPIMKPTLTRTLAQLSLQNRPKTRALAEVAALLVRIVQQEVASGRWPAQVTGSARRR